MLKWRLQTTDESLMPLSGEGGREGRGREGGGGGWEGGRVGGGERDSSGWWSDCGRGCLCGWAVCPDIAAPPISVGGLALDQILNYLMTAASHSTAPQNVCSHVHVM